MTIIEPNKNIKKKRSNLFLAGSIAALFGVAIWSIVTYNETVNLNHSIKISEAKIRELSAQNAELKNSEFQTTDTKRLREVAALRGLVKIEHPRYLEIDSSAILASR